MAGLRAATLSGLFALSALVFGQTVPPAQLAESEQTITVPLFTLVSPFDGTYSETWEELPVQKYGSSVIPILGDTGTVSGTMLEVDSAGMFAICSVGYKPSDGRQFLGMFAEQGTATIVFSQPVSAFGAYWGAPDACDI